MIKQLITSTLLTAAIGIQNATNTTDQVNQYLGKDQTYVNNEYNQNDELSYSKRYSTLNYKDVWIGTNIQVKARAIQQATRDITENQYTLKQCLILKLNSSLTIDKWRISISENEQYTNLLDSSAYLIGYYPTPAQSVIDFLDGKDYLNYNDMETIWNTLTTYTQIDYLSGNTNIKYYNNTDYIGNYLIIRTIYDYNASKITDEGAFMNTVIPYNDVTQIVTWEVTAQNGEIVDIPGMMFTILGMPFAWISTAFNFTIFPGTPYAVNLSNILMAIIISLIVLYIVKKIIK